MRAPRVFRTVIARFTSESPRRNCRRTTLSETWEIPNSDRRVMPNSSGTSWVMITLTLRRAQRCKQRVDVFAEPDLVATCRPQVAEAVDGHPLCSGALDQIQQVVDPFVEIEIDRGRNISSTFGSLSDQENPCTMRSSWTGFSWNVAKSPCSPNSAPAEDEMQRDEGLPGAGRSGDERRGSSPVAISEHVVEDGNTRGDALERKVVGVAVVVVGERGKTSMPSLETRHYFDIGPVS